MRIQHNIMAMNAYRNYNTNNSALSKNLEKLSSGYAINRAGDDAAGLAISEKMRAQITGLDTAQNNAQDGISLIQTAEGALTEVHDMLNRMYELANKAANGTYESSNRSEIQKEIDQLADEIDRISETSNFNGIKLLNGDMGRTLSITNPVSTGIQAVRIYGGGAGEMKDLGAITLTTTGKVSIAAGTGDAAGLTWEAVGTSALSGKDGGTITFKAKYEGTNEELKRVYSGMQVAVTVAAADINTGKYANQQSITARLDGADKGLKLQIGDTADNNNQLFVTVGKMSAEALGVGSLNVGTQDDSLSSLSIIKGAIEQVSGVRGTLGAAQNRLEHTINNLSVNEENIQNAESAIRDTDVAEEMMAYTKNNILIQSAQAMLAQSNQVPQGVLQLLQ